MKIKYSGLALAIASTCGLWAPMSHATIKLAQEEALESGSIVRSYGDLQLKINILPALVNSYTVKAESPLYIVASLTGGAEFAISDPTNLGLYCTNSAGTASIIGISVEPGATADSVSFNLDSGFVIGSECYVLVSGSTAGFITAAASPMLKSLSSQTDQTLNVTFIYKDGINIVSAATSTELVEFAPAISFNATNRFSLSTAANATISVADGSTLFTAGSLSSKYAAFVGYAKANIDAEVRLREASAVSGGLALSDLVSSITFNIAGLPLEGASTVGFAYGAPSCDSLDAEITPTGGNTITFATVSVADVQASGVSFCLFTDGSTALQEGQISLTVETVSDFDVDLGGPYDLYYLPKDGASYRALLIPPSTQAERAFVRMTNTSSIAGDVIGTLYDSTGQVGTAQVLGTIQPRQTFVVSAADLEALFGTWSGRARLVIDSQIPELRVLSLLRSRSGILVNMSSEAEN